MIANSLSLLFAASIALLATNAVAEPVFAAGHSGPNQQLLQWRIG